MKPFLLTVAISMLVGCKPKDDFGERLEKICEGFYAQGYRNGYIYARTSEVVHTFPLLNFELLEIGRSSFNKEFLEETMK